LSEAIFLVENNQLVQNHRHCQKPLTLSKLFVENNLLVEIHQLGEKQSTWSKLTDQYDQQMVRSHNTNQTQSNWSGTILLVKKNQLIKSNYLVRNHQHYKKKTNNMV